MAYNLGHTSTSIASNDSNGANVVAGTGGNVASADGFLGTGFAYVQLLTGTGTRSQAVRMTVHQDSAGIPGTLIGVSTEVVVSNLTVLPNYIVFPSWISGPIPIYSGITYWIGLWWGTVVNASNIQIGAVAAAGHVFFDATETYSSIGLPPNIPTGDSGFAVDYDLYININDHDSFKPNRMPLGV